MLFSFSEYYGAQYYSYDYFQILNSYVMKKMEALPNLYVINNLLSITDI